MVADKLGSVLLMTNNLTITQALQHVTVWEKKGKTPETVSLRDLCAVWLAVTKLSHREVLNRTARHIWEDLQRVKALIPLLEVGQEDSNLHETACRLIGKLDLYPSEDSKVSIQWDNGTWMFILGGMRSRCASFAEAVKEVLGNMRA